uniref:ATP-binding protein n=1 Tax=Nonomuraea pusilla TaxID=46177 RepID=UPI0006E2B155|nr:ATP-binding protein [Nonomuraea pusilla]
MDRAPGLSVRFKLALSHAAFLMLAGALLLAAVWVFLLVFGLVGGGSSQGVGLSLAVVMSITRAHDGTLTLTPRSAGGLRVTVRLPAAPPHSGS